MNRLQIALLANALFSGLSGFILIIAHPSAARLFEIVDSSVFWIVGCVLLFFAATIAYEIVKQRSSAVWWIIVQDVLWVIGSIVLLIWNPFDISRIGMLLVGIVALIVLSIAVLQAMALAKSIGSKRGKPMCVEPKKEHHHNLPKYS